MMHKPLRFDHFYEGAKVTSVDLGQILYKRLKVQGSTLRSRSLEYQSELIQRCASYFFM